MLGSGLLAAWLLPGATTARAASVAPPPAPAATAPPPAPPAGVVPPPPSCTVGGGAGADVLRGTRRADVICGRGGADRLVAGGSDTVLGGGGNDMIDARNGRSDAVFGGAGFDRAWLDERIDLAIGIERSVPASTVVGAPSASAPRLTEALSAAAPAEPPLPLFESGLAALRAPARPSSEAKEPTLPIGRTGWYPHALVGKIYFGLPGDPPGAIRFCSGTVVASDVVLSAAHCVYDRDRGFATFWTFVPRKWDASEPLGRWEARKASVPAEWIEAAGAGLVDYPHDYGFLVLGPNAAGQHIGDVTGTAAIVTNAVSSWLWSVGYPAGGWFGRWGSRQGEGQYPHYCYSPYGSSRGPILDPRGALGYEIGIGCTMTGGSSGGPWFAYANGHWNNIVSVNSHCSPYPHCTQDGDQASSRQMWGPWFTERVRSDLEDAKRL